MSALGKRQQFVMMMIRERTLRSEARRYGSIAPIGDEVGGILVERSTVPVLTVVEGISEIMGEIEIKDIYLCAEVEVVIRHVEEKEIARASMIIVDLVRELETDEEIETTEVVIDMLAIEIVIPGGGKVITIEKGEIERDPVVMIVAVEVRSISTKRSLAKAARKSMIMISESVGGTENEV